jgi:two-component system chemotaxis sensor kinase CheA
MDKLRNTLFDLITSGKFSQARDESSMEELVRYVVLNVALILGGSILTGFGIAIILNGAAIRGLIDLAFTLLCVSSFLLLRTRVPVIIPALIPVLPFAVLCASLVMKGDAQGFAGVWIFAYPSIAVFLLGTRLGSILSLLLLAAVTVITFVPGLSGFNYETPTAFRIAATYVLTFALPLVYERIRVTKDVWLRQLTRELQAERDEIAAMKDNLRAGLFLIDRDYVIQGQYSKALEEVLAARNLQGKNFIDLLSASIKAREQEGLRDYLVMVFDQSYNEAMLEEINPLGEFEYVSVETRETKTLRCSFAPVDRGQGELLILGAVEDITAEKELQRQLSAEEAKRQEEMASLFEVIQVEPRVFGDFVEDAEYEFERINGILKDKRISTPQALVEIYQSVHAVKSNAVILGLDNFAAKVHELESKIQHLRERESISFEDTLRLTVDLEKILLEKDKFRITINKILSFKTGEARSQGHHVLVESLRRAGEKASADLEKKVRLEAEDIDQEALERGPRRAIKEVLLQLVRNAVYHGIEPPAERVSRGKDAVGIIRLSIKAADNRLHIKLRDDGKGLDFGRIREKAEKLGLIREAEAGEDKDRLLQVIFSPGFSTAEEAGTHAGRGIGLNLVRDRIRDLKGTVRLQTEEGKGTAFNICIPLENPG